MTSDGWNFLATFHVNQGVEHASKAEQASSTGVLGATGLLNKGGGSNRLPGLVTEQPGSQIFN